MVKAHVLQEFKNVEVMSKYKVTGTDISLDTILPFLLGNFLRS